MHLSLFPELGNKVRRAFIEGVHLESVHLERVDCSCTKKSVNWVAQEKGEL